MNDDGALNKLGQINRKTSTIPKVSEKAKLLYSSVRGKVIKIALQSQHILSMYVRENPQELVTGNKHYMPQNHN